jgi:C1A family cysteine protease
MNEQRISYAGGDAVIPPPQQRPLYASDDEDDESDYAAAAAETTPQHDDRHDLAEDTDAESDNDEEMMNPYFMNPSFQFVNERSRNLDSAALLPPSMELANVTTTQRRQMQSSHAVNQGQTLDLFDPYSPTRKIGRTVLDDMQLEMEEESIDFMSSSPMKNNPSNKPKFTMFGPLVQEQQSPEEREEGGFQDCESSFIDSSSFSPVFPKHHTTRRQTHYNSSNSNAEYGEAMPLSGSPSAARQRTYHYYHGQGTIGTIKALGGDILLWIKGGHGHRNPFSQSASQRFNVRGTNTSSRRHYQRHSWVAYFRMFVVSLAVIFGLSTMTMMKHMLLSEIDTSSTVVKYQEEAEAEQSARSNDKPDLQVLKKIENARLKARQKKQHWWNRKQDLEVKVEPGFETVESNETESDNSKRHYQAVTNDKDAFHGLIVESAEDGTLLIKLPPPKMHLDQPGLAARKFITAKEEQPDETIFIKLPYPEQRRTLSEKADSSKMLKFSPPPPFMEHKRKHNHHSFHFHEENRDPSVLESLRSEFDSWISQHKKTYSSHNEREHRFQIWRSSHHRIQKKNKIHGPCRMSGRAVFGHGPFSDLSPDEFREKYLTGYHRPRFHKEKKQEATQASKTMRVISPNRRATGEIIGSVKRHPSIQRRLDEHVGGKYQANVVSGCRSWLDVSCILRKFFGYAVIGGTREPVFDENTYPSAMDWRAMGVVSSVHSQESCGACWAITAVETIESAYAISTGTFIDLAEEEVIACDGTCDMCNGGWPQNAYEYVMKHGGLPKKSSDYDADFLLSLTSVINEGSDAMSEYETSSYFGQICPSGSREGGESYSRSGDSQYGTGFSATRYGQIKGYGYATDRCICYTDGSGCDCDKQNEKTAVLNIASYGPAAVCLEASTWSDYSSGIITSASGCGSGFLDMNHCVEVVGYAFTDGSNSNNDNNSKSHSGDGEDDGKREGYWIVKNQWSTYWGMGGYAYVSMGDNTCGILNDMTQVYM